jgi:hypothetical protein
MRIKTERFRLAPKQKYRAKFSVTVDFGITDRIEVKISDLKFALSSDCLEPDKDEDGNHAKRVLSFRRRDQPPILSGSRRSWSRSRSSGSAKD